MAELPRVEIDLQPTGNGTRVSVDGVEQRTLRGMVLQSVVGQPSRLTLDHVAVHGEVAGTAGVRHVVAVGPHRGEGSTLLAALADLQAVVATAQGVPTPAQVADSDDWTREDAARVLALPLRRAMAWRRQYGDDADRMVYSNGTEADMGLDDAVAVLAVGPWLTQVLAAGVRALRGQPHFEAFIMALYSGDHDRLLAAEDTARTPTEG